MHQLRRNIDAIDLRQLSRVAPALAGDLAYRRFCTPRLSERRTRDHDQLTARARFHLRSALWQRVMTREGAIQTFALEAVGPARRGTVLVVHGWTSESSFMAVFAEQIRRAGFRVMLLDLPAHGLSAGTRTSLIGCARAIVDIADRLGPPDFILAHSMGCLATLLALEGRFPMPHAIRARRVVFVASPNRFQDVTGEFGSGLGLTARAQRVYEHHLERIAHRDIGGFTAARLLSSAGLLALLLHSRDDEEVRFRCAEEIAAACPATELLAFEGLGHRKILYAPPVIKAAVAFLNEA